MNGSVEEALSTPLGVLVFGRDAGCDVRIDHPTVSTRHARLVWTRRGLVVEDLGSTNGTYVAGTVVARAFVEKGADVRFGEVHLPWSDAKVRAFLRRGGPSGTMVMPATAKVAAAPRPARGADDAATPPRWLKRALGLVAGVGTGLAIVALGAYVAREVSAPSARHAVTGSSTPEPDEVADTGPLPRERAVAIAAAIDSSNAETRNTAVKIAAGDEGPFHVEQVARLWTHVRGRWHYVNDPQGSEYFARASETITNEYAGDCDDFAIVLAAMVTSIGGEARVVVMNAGTEGHAYAEACIRMNPTEVGTRLATYYRRKWDPYLGRQRVDRIHYRTSDSCPLWLNLDWSAGVPGGPYVSETWAVSVGADGSMQTLAPAIADPPVDAGVTATRSRRTARSATAP